MKTGYQIIAKELGNEDMDLEEITSQINTLKSDLENLKEEYADRKAQFGDEYLWKKHEDEELIDDIMKR